MFSNAIRLKVRVSDSPFVDVDPKVCFSHQDVIEDTPYILSPEAMGKIDFSRMKVSKNNEIITVPAGDFNCSKIYVTTDSEKDYCDEGFSLWRSQQVPLLGIVRMEFSKTLYWEKWKYRNESGPFNTIKDFISYIYRKRVPGRRNSDTHIVNLLKYG